VEAQSCGTPIIAYQKGGYLETVVDGVTGEFFSNQSAGSIAQAVKSFETKEEQFLPENIRANALRFSEKIFNRNFVSEVKKVLHDRR